MANYAIMRIEKRKMGSVGRICNHHERLKTEYKSNPDIDTTKSHLNYHIIEPHDKYYKAVLERIDDAGARRRKDSVVLQDCYVGATPEWIKEKSIEEQREYFDYAYQFFEERFGKENIISAVVHMDESTPHMHLCFVPITEDGRLSSKSIIGGPSGMRELQDKFYEHIHERYTDISRGTPASVTHRKHIPAFMFKNAATLYEHYDEICSAINDIGLVNNAKKKDAALELLGRYAPEMAQLGSQLHTTDQYIKSLEGELDMERKNKNYFKSENTKHTSELMQANIKIRDLNAEQKKLQKQIDKIPQDVLDDLAKKGKSRKKERS